MLSIFGNKVNYMTLFMEGKLRHKTHNTFLVAFFRLIYSKSLKNFMI